MNKFIRMWILYKPANSEYILCWDMIERITEDDDIDLVLRYGRDLVAEYFEGCEIKSSTYKIITHPKK